MLLNAFAQLGKNTVLLRIDVFVRVPMKFNLHLQGLLPAARVLQIKQLTQMTLLNVGVQLVKSFILG